MLIAHCATYFPKRFRKWFSRSWLFKGRTTCVTGPAVCPSKIMQPSPSTIRAYLSSRDSVSHHLVASIDQLHESQTCRDMCAVSTRLIEMMHDKWSLGSGESVAPFAPVGSCHYFRTAFPPSGRAVNPTQGDARSVILRCLGNGHEVVHFRVGNRRNPSLHYLTAGATIKRD